MVVYIIYRFQDVPFGIASFQMFQTMQLFKTFVASFEAVGIA